MQVTKGPQCSKKLIQDKIIWVRVVLRPFCLVVFGFFKEKGFFSVLNSPGRQTSHL